jgi:hypothetical protein
MLADDSNSLTLSGYGVSLCETHENKSPVSNATIGIRMLGIAVLSYKAPITVIRQEVFELARGLLLLIAACSRLDSIRSEIRRSHNVEPYIIIQLSGRNWSFVFAEWICLR